MQCTGKTNTNSRARETPANIGCRRCSLSPTMGVYTHPVRGPFRSPIPIPLQLPGTPLPTLQPALPAPTANLCPLPSCATHAACKFKFHADDEVEWSEVYQLAITSRNRLDFLDKVRSAGFLEANRRVRSCPRPPPPPSSPRNFQGSAAALPLPAAPAVLTPPPQPQPLTRKQHLSATPPCHGSDAPSASLLPLPSQPVYS